MERTVGRALHVVDAVAIDARRYVRITLAE
jgi:hypothetical protein